jgi:hypothetical protein
MRCLLLLPYLLLITSICYSQDSTTIQAQAEKNAVAFYTKYIGENSSLYNGSEYVAYDFHIKGYQYFQWSTLQQGTVNYNGTRYDNINIAYDIVRDELITFRYNDNVRIRLVTEKIDYFSWPGHFFIRLIQDSLNKPVITTGFYERLYDGKMKLYAKRKKKIMETITSEGDNLSFKEISLYLVQKNGQFYSMQKEGELLDLLNDKRKEVKKYLRKNKIKFKKAPEKAILTAIEYYDQLKN